MFLWEDDAVRGDLNQSKSVDSFPEEAGVLQSEKFTI
jgi:hypothetical protein